jgi:hypothetical protein
MTPIGAFSGVMSEAFGHFKTHAALRSITARNESEN